MSLTWWIDEAEAQCALTLAWRRVGAAFPSTHGDAARRLSDDLVNVEKCWLVHSLFVDRSAEGGPAFFDYICSENEKDDDSCRRNQEALAFAFHQLRSAVASPSDRGEKTLPHRFLALHYRNFVSGGASKVRSPATEITREPSAQVAAELWIGQIRALLLWPELRVRIDENLQNDGLIRRLRDLEAATKESVQHLRAIQAAPQLRSRDSSASGLIHALAGATLGLAACGSGLDEACRTAPQLFAPTDVDDVRWRVEAVEDQRAGLGEKSLAVRFVQAIRVAGNDVRSRIAARLRGLTNSKLIRAHVTSPSACNLEVLKEIEDRGLRARLQWACCMTALCDDRPSESPWPRTAWSELEDVLNAVVGGGRLRLRTRSEIPRIVAPLLRGFEVPNDSAAAVGVAFEAGASHSGVELRAARPQSASLTESLHALADDRSTNESDRVAIDDDLKAQCRRLAEQLAGFDSLKSWLGSADGDEQLSQRRCLLWQLIGRLQLAVELLTRGSPSPEGRRQLIDAVALITQFQIQDVRMEPAANAAGTVPPFDAGPWIIVTAGDDRHESAMEPFFGSAIGLPGEPLLAPASWLLIGARSPSSLFAAFWQRRQAEIASLMDDDRQWSQDAAVRQLAETCVRELALAPSPGSPAYDHAIALFEKLRARATAAPAALRSRYVAVALDLFHWLRDEAKIPVVPDGIDPQSLHPRLASEATSWWILWKKSSEPDRKPLEPCEFSWRRQRAGLRLSGTVNLPDELDEWSELTDPGELSLFRNTSLAEVWERAKSASPDRKQLLKMLRASRDEFRASATASIPDREFNEVMEHLSPNSANSPKVRATLRWLGYLHRFHWMQSFPKFDERTGLVWWPEGVESPPSVVWESGGEADKRPGWSLCDVRFAWRPERATGVFSAGAPSPWLDRLLELQHVPAEIDDARVIESSRALFLACLADHLGSSTTRSDLPNPTPRGDETRNRIAKLAHAFVSDVNESIEPTAEDKDRLLTHVRELIKPWNLRILPDEFSFTSGFGDDSISEEWPVEFSARYEQGTLFCRFAVVGADPDLRFGEDRVLRSAGPEPSGYRDLRNLILQLPEVHRVALNERLDGWPASALAHDLEFRVGEFHREYWMIASDRLSESHPALHRAIDELLDRFCRQWNWEQFRPARLSDFVPPGDFLDVERRVLRSADCGPRGIRSGDVLRVLRPGIRDLNSSRVLAKSRVEIAEVVP